ncbi:6-phosphogluconolactonase [Sphingorhabdus lutea]|uniref:6-phosphogluconolactonase n=1 Tax=Sphingorhabdus lutea TaxID=1913578 RepID=A0A1L3JB60_9SPHN|nr:6-phosphogluconolactonase [Sphingorhabdus lutea]APG62346.1 6-phosphogluconolactonase [Sphingorhabdus lutea]
MTEIEWWEFEDKKEFVGAIAGDISFIIESALDARGQALVAFPGGSTPIPVYEALAASNIRWKNVTIIPTDERLVAVDNPLSNIAKIAKIFLPLGARVLPLNSDAEDYHLAGNAANARLMDLHWPLDLCWLGMGEDGHFASIFPGPDMEAALNGDAAQRAIGVRPDPMPKGVEVDRVTLTASAICEARTCLLSISGAAKRSLLEEAIEAGSKSDRPIGQLFSKLKVPVDIYHLD